jgi:hypothetical protein
MECIVAKAVVPVAPLPEKLQAWAKVRAIWVAMGKNPGVTQALLDAEEKAANTK